jgi:hypothetical protein
MRSWAGSSTDANRKPRSLFRTKRNKSTSRIAGCYRRSIHLSGLGNFLLTGGNNLCLIQFRHVQGFWETTTPYTRNLPETRAVSTGGFSETFSHSKLIHYAQFTRVLVGVVSHQQNTHKNHKFTTNCPHISCGKSTIPARRHPKFLGKTKRDHPKSLKFTTTHHKDRRTVLSTRRWSVLRY